MSQTFGYIIDLSQYKFDETTTGPTWIHAMPCGEYVHPLYGKITLPQERVKRFADSVTQNVRGQDLDIDYDHKEKENVAAGWVKAAEAKDDGLHLLVDWTPRARKHLAEKEYRYFSPEFQDEWTHPATGKKFTDVLFGGGLTNRPYLKGIMPINLSEFFTEPEHEGSKSMTPEQKKALIAKYKLAENATDDQVIEAATKAELKPEVTTDPPENSQLSELQKQIDNLKKLSETNPAIPAVIALMEVQAAEMKRLSETVAKQEATIRLSEMANVVQKLDEKAKSQNYGIPKPVLEGATTFLSEHSTSKKFSDGFYTVVEGILDAKLIQLGEVRKGKGGVPGGNGDAIKQFDEKVNTIVKDEKVSYREAVEKVERDEPQLFSEYREAMAEQGANS